MWRPRGLEVITFRAKAARGQLSPLRRGGAHLAPHFVASAATSTANHRWEMIAAPATAPRGPTGSFDEKTGLNPEDPDRDNRPEHSKAGDCPIRSSLANVAKQIESAATRAVVKPDHWAFCMMPSLTSPSPTLMQKSSSLASSKNRAGPFFTNWVSSGIRSELLYF
jgi:hypothetical protein